MSDEITYQCQYCEKTREFVGYMFGMPKAPVSLCAMHLEMYKNDFPKYEAATGEPPPKSFYEIMVEAAKTAAGDINAYQEILAAAWSKATNIPPADAVITIRRNGDDTTVFQTIEIQEGGESLKLRKRIAELEAQVKELETPKPEPHCGTCICGKRAPVQGDVDYRKGPGSISWTEHLEAYSAYASKYGTSQSAETLAERGGFSFGELTDLLGKHPKSWRSR